MSISAYELLKSSHQALLGGFGEAATSVGAPAAIDMTRTGSAMSSAEMRSIYETAPIGLAFLTPDCRYVLVNQRLTEICGIPVADHIGRSVRETPMWQNKCKS